MKLLYKVAIAGLLFVTALLIFFNRENYIAHKNWKYRSGDDIGDWISFDQNTKYSINKGKLYHNNCHVANIIICLGGLLVIKNPEQGEVGYYVKK